jgi:hypothetical protein
MIYHRETVQVGYKSNAGKETRVFDALEWLAAMCSHVPGKSEQMVRYYGHYINVARGKRKKADADVTIPCILEPELTDKAFRQNWARLIQKIYEADPLVCQSVPVLCGSPPQAAIFERVLSPPSTVITGLFSIAFFKVSWNSNISSYLIWAIVDKAIMQPQTSLLFLLLNNFVKSFTYSAISSGLIYPISYKTLIQLL